VQEQTSKEVEEQHVQNGYVELLAVVEEHDGAVRLVEQVPFDLVDLVVQEPIALGELVPAALVVVRSF
jgi:hypothetical protein